MNRSLADEATSSRSGAPGALVLTRVGAVCGVAFTALTATTTALAPPPPESTAPAARIRDYLTEHTGGLSVSTALMGIAAMTVIGFFALVHHRLRTTDRDETLVPTTFILAACLVVTSTLIGVVLQAALVHQIAPAADDSTLAASYALWDRVFHTAPAMGMAVALMAASITGLRRRMLPRWVCVVGLAASTLMLVDIVEDLATTGTNLGPLGLIAFGLANVWIVGVSVACWRHPTVTAPGG